jgi:hypothetical protein
MNSTVREMSSEEAASFEALQMDPWRIGKSPNPFLLAVAAPLFMMMGGGAAAVPVMKGLEFFGVTTQTTRPIGIVVFAVGALLVLAFIVLLIVEARRLSRRVAQDLADRKVEVFAVRPKEAASFDGVLYLSLESSEVLKLAGTWVEVAVEDGTLPNDSFEIVALVHSRLPLAVHLLGKPLRSGVELEARSFTLSQKGGPGPSLTWTVLKGPLPRSHREIKALRKA